MKTSSKIKVFGFIAVVLTQTVCQGALAGECVIHIARKPCPGKSKESLSKPPEESKKAGSAEACGKAATQACQNKRHDITQDKVVTATFDNVAVEGNKDFCLAATPGVFNPADDFPFRGKPDCK